MNVWAWSDPLGLGAFILAIALTLALLGWTIRQLASAPNNSNRRGR